MESLIPQTSDLLEIFGETISSQKITHLFCYFYCLLYSFCKCGIHYRNAIAFRMAKHSVQLMLIRCSISLKNPGCCSLFWRGLRRDEIDLLHKHMMSSGKLFIKSNNFYNVKFSFGKLNGHFFADHGKIGKQKILSKNRAKFRIDLLKTVS